MDEGFGRGLFSILLELDINNIYNYFKAFLPV